MKFIKPIVVVFDHEKYCDDESNGCQYASPELEYCLLFDSMLKIENQFFLKCARCLFSEKIEG